MIPWFFCPQPEWLLAGPFSFWTGGLDWGLGALAAHTSTSPGSQGLIFRPRALKLHTGIAIYIFFKLGGCMPGGFPSGC